MPKKTAAKPKPVFTQSELKKLRAWQSCDFVHPLTCFCAVPQEERVLKPFPRGLVCPNCGLTQTKGVPKAVFDTDVSEITSVLEY